MSRVVPSVSLPPALLAPSRAPSAALTIPLRFLPAFPGETTRC